jgi:Helicase conserved C-terminal domain
LKTIRTPQVPSRKHGMSKHRINRDETILRILREELIGPSRTGKELDVSVAVSFENGADANGPWIDRDSKEEILTRDRPTKRYGVGVLYPFATMAEDLNTDPGDLESIRSIVLEAPELDREALSQQTRGNKDAEVQPEGIKDIADRASRADTGDQDDGEVTATNTYRPSSMGITFLARLTGESTLTVCASGARYEELKVIVNAQDRAWWVRRPWTCTVIVAANELTSREPTTIVRAISGGGGQDLSAEIFSRPYHEPENHMITVSLINRSVVAHGSVDSYCCFQSEFSVVLDGETVESRILPYPEAGSNALDAEEKSINLLYRQAQTFAIGHGCAADWDSSANTVRATCLPTFDAPSITPDILRRNNTPLAVPMALLAGISPQESPFPALEEVVTLYEEWITDRRKEKETLSHEHQDAANRHLAQCTESAARMRQGIDFLRANPLALEAFQLANRAILLQQIRSSRRSRRRSFDNIQKIWTFPDAPYPPVSYTTSDGKGSWRAFQIAFILMSLQSTADRSAEDRETVELIWFPTGGGKTEAYLGLAAFAMFMRRLENPNDTGVSVIMRYTLRLLTAQQFQRASTLLVAMEYLRRSTPSLNASPPFSIGIWLGSGISPNKREDAVRILRELQKGSRGTQNKFLLTRCPWCGAEMGPVKGEPRQHRNTDKTPGYTREGTSVVFKCPDPACDFSSGLPVYVVDEDLYEHRPTLIIGTVDKFAMLAWEPKARSLFGIGSDGGRVNSPPGLIIQDELHLISGPLGSMVGLYEAAIEELCTDERYEAAFRPKIVSSTATIRRYEDQIRSLFGRQRVALFPPPGLSTSDSFFSRYKLQEDGSVATGRKYVGIHAPGLGSLQTVQVRTFCALLEAPMAIGGAEEQDPWWTLLTFFNSLRELGTTLTLFQSDIPDYQKTLRMRNGLDWSQLRRVRNIMELTGRLQGDEVQDAIDSLEIRTSEKSARPIDVCLASNIIEVGIDIDRLSLICVVGQPKTTSQYIQVTGRVGRKMDRPGLVVAIYGASKPRDRSHFERFRTYHERLYAHVEPTSVTPFSPPVLDRALHAIMALYARQAGTSANSISPDPFPEQLMAAFLKKLIERVKVVNPDEVQNVADVFQRREREWRRWQRIHWRGRLDSDNQPLLRVAGAYVSPANEKISWATPMSLRNVDAECQVEISYAYLNDDVDPR